MRASTRHAGQARPGWILPPLPLPLASAVRFHPSTVWASSRFDPRQCGSALPLAQGLCEYYLGLCGLAPRPCGLPLRPCGSPLSHLAGVGQCPLAIGHGCLVGLLAGVLDRRTVSTAVYVDVQWGGPGLARLRVDRRQRPCTLSHLAGVGQCPLAIGHGCLVGLLVGVPPRVGSPTAPCTLRVWRQWCRSLLVRVQLGRYRVADRQRRAASPVSGIPDRARPDCRPAPLWMRSRLNGQSVRTGSRGGPAKFNERSSRQPRWACHGRVTNHSASDPLTIGRWRRRRVRCQLSPKQLGCCRPGRRADPDSERRTRGDHRP